MGGRGEREEGSANTAEIASHKRDMWGGCWLYISLVWRADASCFLGNVGKHHVV